jgi:hypothetical protein
VQGHFDARSKPAAHESAEGTFVKGAANIGAALLSTLTCPACIGPYVTIASARPGTATNRPATEQPATAASDV